MQTLDKRQVLIVGGGAMGSFFAQTVRGNGHAAQVYDTNPERSELDEAAFDAAWREAEVLCLCVDARASAALLEERGANTKAGAIIVFSAKGLSGTGEFMHEVSARRAPKARAAIVAGPLLAAELADKKPTACVIASSDNDARQTLSSLLAAPWLAIATTDDMLGIAWATVLKNCYTMLLGAAEGCGLGKNACGMLFMKSVAEMALLAERVGGKRESTYGIAGVADFFASAASETSRNHLCGLTLGREGACGKNCEGAHSARMLLTRLPGTPPLLALLGTLLGEPKNIKNSLEKEILRRYQ